MKNPSAFILKSLCCSFLFVSVFFSCKNYGSDDIPSDPGDLKKLGERYDTNTTGLSSAAYDPKDTVGHDKTQMQPANSTGGK